MTLLSSLYFYFFLFLFPQFFKTLKISNIIFMHSLIIFFSHASFGWNFILYISNGYEKKSK